MENPGFWLAAGGMALAVAGLLLAALGRAQAAPAAAASDLKVYRDQLAEVERDLGRGVLAPEEAERLRTEVSRRLLEADRTLAAGSAAGPAAAAPARGRQRALAAGLILAVLGGSVWAYLRLGAPGYPDLPLATRLALSEERMASRPSQAEALAELAQRGPQAPAAAPSGMAADPEFLELMERLRAALKERPDDVAGLALLVRNEAGLGNLAAAEAAQRALIAAKGAGASADDHAALAELMILQAEGYVSPEAEEALVAALAADPGHPLARYFSGLMFAQAGRADRTFQIWQALLQEGPQDAPWIGPILAQMEEVAARAGVRYTPPDVLGGPDAAALAAAGAMTEEERQEMIRGMVSQLSDRLASEGGPVEDWARLITSLGVLGETDRAQAILDEALQRFDGLEAEQMFLREAAIGAGLTP
jgi:cytochrome c-type biogenesis protein CcmH